MDAPILKVKHLHGITGVLVTAAEFCAEVEFNGKVYDITLNGKVGSPEIEPVFGGGKIPAKAGAYEITLKEKK